MRWASEGFFSAVKQMFGEDIRTTSRENKIQEVKMKFLFCGTIAYAVQQRENLEISEKKIQMH
jgi:hypothetical protein